MTEVARTPVPMGLAAKGLILFSKHDEITFTPEIRTKIDSHYVLRYIDQDAEEESYDGMIASVFYNRTVLQCLLKKLEEKYSSEYEILFGADTGVGEYIEFHDLEDREVLKSFTFEYPKTPEVRNAKSIFYEMYSSKVSDAERPTQQEVEQAKNALLSSIALVEIDHYDELPPLSSEFMRMFSECSGTPELKSLKKATAVMRQKQTIGRIASEKGLPADVEKEMKSYYPIPKAGTRHKKKKTRKQKKQTTRRRRRM